MVDYKLYKIAKQTVERWEEQCFAVAKARYNDRHPEFTSYNQQLWEVRNSLANYLESAKEGGHLLPNNYLNDHQIMGCRAWIYRLMRLKSIGGNIF